MRYEERMEIREAIADAVDAVTKLAQIIDRLLDEVDEHDMATFSLDEDVK